MAKVSVPLRPLARPLRAVIVGAAGTAGQAFIESLHRFGVEVIAVDQDEVGLARLPQDQARATMPVDALDDDHAAGLFEGIEAEFGEIDLLINVAGRGYVRTLAMMRMSRAFNRRPRARPAYIVNVAAPADPDDGLVTYAGSEIAFDRLSQGLSETIANPLIRILTLHRLESRAAFADISERVCAELRDLGAMDVPGTQQRAIH